MISVLCPTRGRLEPLKASLASLGECEILLAVDEDDPAVYHGLGRVCRVPRVGYARLHEYYNMLAREATGDWLLLWNDDVLMGTPDWQAIVESYAANRVLWPCERGLNRHMCTFPVIPRAWVQAVGHFSLSPHCDSWWEHVGRLLDRLERIPVDLTHDRADLTGNNDDATYREREYRSEEFEEMATARERDAAVIAERCL